jgi:1-acyl-sn-glycerol-3-phosphate acyltransferase
LSEITLKCGINEFEEIFVTIAIAYFRTILFYVLFYVPFTVVWSLFWYVFAWFIPQPRRAFIIVGGWSKVAMFASRWILGIKYTITGLENVPKDKAYVIVSNHQSTWETFFFTKITTRQTQVIKKSLLKIPFFGWVFALAKPIAIDRADRKGAMKQLIELGVKRLSVGTNVMIFPEGTRSPPGEMRNFSRGGFAIAAEADVCVLPVSHNSGSFWLNTRFYKLPGTIEVVIHAPLPMSKDNMKSQMRHAHHLVGTSLAKSEARSITPKLKKILAIEEKIEEINV